jgi:arginine repressor
MIFRKAMKAIGSVDTSMFFQSIAIMRGRFWTEGLLYPKSGIIGGGIFVAKKIRDEKAESDQTERSDVESYIRELFNEDADRWESQQKIADEIKKRHNISFHQTTIKRALTKMKAEKIDGEWTLERALLREDNLSDLRKSSRKSLDDSAVFSKGHEIYMLKTKPYYNALMAKKIQDAFKDEICCVICPNITDLIIFGSGNPCNKDSASREFEKVISEMIEDVKARSKEKS